ncbi:hypothetical protein GUJ93_ZPchr0004g39289 [Zizania palustris]|uniref:BHLH domain-containing protein n=1 Tax=Zizania palustris TaxID=103762 RepID=A0A8J5S1P0_ZIZPA|nr:hypothetical protein GUJ93_ZPchr0004g39289 [Zizania palustris]
MVEALSWKRSQLAAAVRNIGWSYAIFWSIPSNRPGVLTWKDGFYNGEIKTRKIANSTNLTADEIVLQRSDQLRELYESLLSGDDDHHQARRPIAALSPEDLADTEWYYMICMTYAFRHGQGLPGKSFASNECVWLCNVQSADSKTFLRALLAKSTSIQTIVCIPFMSGVLELGTTDTVSEDPALVNRITTSFWDPQPFSACSSVEPSSSPSPDVDETGDDVGVVFEDIGHGNAVEATMAGGEVAGCASNANFEQITMEIDELYSICKELDVVPSLDDNSSWLVDDPWSFPLVPTSSSPVAVVTANTDVDDVVNLDGSSIDGGSCRSCFVAWKTTDSDEVAVPFNVGEPQKLLKKAVAAGAWMNCGRGSAVITQESSIKNHVMSERRRREKLNDMFGILKSVVPSIHKVDKASILAETIAYLRELERRVEELESKSEQPSRRPTETRVRRCRGIAGKKVTGAGAKRKASQQEVADGGDDHEAERARHSSNLNVTVMDKEVLLEVHCGWKELLMTRVFDAIKSLSLDVLSVQASTLNGLLGLKIQAKV